MKIIVPIAGSNDEDFVNKFNLIKPLTKIGNHTMLEKFVSHFNFNYEFIFICNSRDLIETNLLNLINSLKIKKQIISIKDKTSNVIETLYHAKEYVNKDSTIYTFALND